MFLKCTGGTFVILGGRVIFLLVRVCMYSDFSFFCKPGAILSVNGFNLQIGILADGVMLRIRYTDPEIRPNSKSLRYFLLFLFCHILYRFEDPRQGCRSYLHIGGRVGRSPPGLGMQCHMLCPHDDITLRTSHSDALVLGQTMKKLPSKL